MNIDDRSTDHREDLEAGSGGRADQDAMLERYRAAEAVLDVNVALLVLNETVTPNWVGGAAFWYRRQRSDGAEYVWVERGAARPAFDHLAVSAALGAAVGEVITPWGLVAETIAADGGLVLRSNGGRWRVEDGRVSDLGAFSSPDSRLLISPRGDQGLLAREHDLYLRDLASGAERRLTDNGETDFAWGQYPDAGLAGVVRRRDGLPFAPFGWSWSPDGAFLVGGRVDERHIEPYPFLESVPTDGTVRPRTYQIRQPLVGEPGPVFAGCAIEVATGRCVPIDLPDYLRQDIGEIEPIDWSDDRRRVFFAAVLNRAARAVLVEIDVVSGAVRIPISEQPGGFIKIGSEMYKRHAVAILAGGREAIWYSERSGFGHLYRYDLATGALLNAITSGEWLVRDILKVDEVQGRVYFVASGREAGDPYLRRIYRAALDGRDLTLLSPEVADHTLEGAPASALARLYGTLAAPSPISPDSTVFVDTWSDVATPSQSVLRSTEDGAVVLPLETADASALFAIGWRPPEPFVVKAADGETELHGVLYRPAPGTREPAPLIDAIYGGPQVTVTPKNFRAARCGIGSQVRAALTAFGFAVGVVDGRGTPLRSKAFQDAGYHSFADTCVDDHAAAINALCRQNPGLDANRVGIYGHSFGGYTAARAILRYPDLIKVAVSSAGSHSLHGLYAAMTSVTQPPDYGGGLPTKPTADAVPQHYRDLDNAIFASNLQGKLLLAYGDMDENVYPAVTLQLCAALNRANRTYDLLYFPNATHGFTADPYFVRRLWDYFVEHLLGEQPPPNYAIGGRAGGGLA